ncbi:MAG: cation:proton antiporter [Thermoleophilia bacterium]
MSVDIGLIVAGAAILALGLLSNVIKRLWLSVPLLALLAGVLLGPEVLGAVEPDRLHGERKVLEELARVALAVSLVGTALQMTRADLQSVWRRAASLLSIGMVGMWLLTSLGAWLVLGLPLWLGLLLGAILTPTDPVVASTLVTGRLAEANLPRWLRRSLQLEAGANDGLALVFVLVPALVLTLPGDDPGAIAGEVAGQVALALVAGAAIGAAAAKVVDLAEDHQAMSGGFFLVSALALALLTLGAVHALGGTGILGAFVAGLTFSLMLEERHAEELEQTQDALQHLLVVPVFLLFGTMLPWDGWIGLGWSGLVFALWALLVRRPAAAALALAVAPGGTPRRGVAFLSWYGPIGVAAIYYALFVERLALEEFERVFAAGTLAIAVSVLAFAVTATPGVRHYAGRRARTTLRHPLSEGVDEAP